MKLKTSILVIFLVFTGVLNAQTDFRPGYLIKNSGDTLYGEIDYRNDLLMGASCRFKDSNNEKVKYLPCNIAEFKFEESRHFVSKTVDEKCMFLEYLVKGELNLYYLRDEDGDHYFIEKKDKPLIEMEYKEKICMYDDDDWDKYEDDELVLYQSVRHIQLLELYTEDLPELKSAINRIKRPNHYNLIKVVSLYNRKISRENGIYTSEQKNRSGRISIEPFCGIINAWGGNFNLTGSNIYFWLPRINEKFYLKTGIQYFNDVNDIGHLIFPIQIRYLYNVYRIQPKFSFGANFHYTFWDGKKVFFHTMCLNTGLNIRIIKSINFSMNFSSDYTPLSWVLSPDHIEFELIYKSITAGLVIGF